MVAIDKQWGSSRLEMSFPGLGPNTVHGLIPKGSMVKTDTKVDGLITHHGTGDLAAVGFC